MQYRVRSTEYAVLLQEPTEGVPLGSRVRQNAGRGQPKSRVLANAATLGTASVGSCRSTPYAVRGSQSSPPCTAYWVLGTAYEVRAISPRSPTLPALPAVPARGVPSP